MITLSIINFWRPRLNKGEEWERRWLLLCFNFPKTATLFTIGFTKNSGRLSRTPWPMSVDTPLTPQLAIPLSRTKQRPIGPCGSLWEFSGGHYLLTSGLSAHSIVFVLDFDLTGEATLVWSV